MPRALPSPAPPRTPVRPRWPWPRTRVVAAHPVRTDTVVAAVDEALKLWENPNVRILHARRISPDQTKMVIRYTDRTVSALPPRRAPIRIVIDEDAARTARTFLVNTAKIVGLWTSAALMVAAVAVGVWHFWGDEITAAVKVLIVVAAVAGLAGIVWLLSAKAGICPGLHCPGCPHH